MTSSKRVDFLKNFLFMQANDLLELQTDEILAKVTGSRKGMGNFRERKREL